MRHACQSKVDPEAWARACNLEQGICIATYNVQAPHTWSSKPRSWHRGACGINKIIRDCARLPMDLRKRYRQVSNHLWCLEEALASFLQPDLCILCCLLEARRGYPA